MQLLDDGDEQVFDVFELLVFVQPRSDALDVHLGLVVVALVERREDGVESVW